MATFTRTTTTLADSGIKRLIATHPLIAYFVLAFGLMWKVTTCLGSVIKVGSDAR